MVSDGDEGKYWQHLAAVPSVTPVSMTMAEQRCSTTMCQKSCTVCCSGPCVAMYRHCAGSPACACKLVLDIVCQTKWAMCVDEATEN